MGFSACSYYGGIGGGLLGLKLAGITPTHIFDDRPFVPEKIVKETWEAYGNPVTWSAHIPDDIEFVVSSPPCKRFSALGMKKKDRLDFHPFELEFFKVWQEVNRSQPKIVIVENVPRIDKHIKTDCREACFSCNGFVLFLINYQLTTFELNSRFFGVPQSRRRKFWVAIRKDVHERAPKYITARINSDFFGDAPAITQLTPSLPEFLTVDVEEAFREIEGLPNMEKPRHSPERIKGFAALHPGQSYYGTPNNMRISLYKCAPVVTSSKSRLVHPIEPRTLTVRECARLQGFPDDFVFRGPLTAQLDQVGCSIPPPITRHLAEKYLLRLLS